MEHTVIERVYIDSGRFDPYQHYLPSYHPGRVQRVDSPRYKQNIKTTQLLEQLVY